MSINMYGKESETSNEDWITFFEKEIEKKDTYEFFYTLFSSSALIRVRLKYLNTVLSMLKNNPDAIIEGKIGDYKGHRLNIKSIKAAEELEQGYKMNRNVAEEIVDDKIERCSKIKMICWMALIATSTNFAFTLAWIINGREKLDVTNMFFVPFDPGIILFFLSGIDKKCKLLEYLNRISERLEHDVNFAIPYTKDTFIAGLDIRAKEYYRRQKNKDNHLF